MIFKYTKFIPQGEQELEKSCWVNINQIFHVEEENDVLLCLINAQPIEVYNTRQFPVLKGKGKNQRMEMEIRNVKETQYPIIEIRKPEEKQMFFELWDIIAKQAKDRMLK